jgi:arylsulfatase A-like enzyme
MTSRNPERPNIVFILTDDQGAWALGCAGNGEIRTPRLDRLAAEGARFTDFFCASPVCSPARASILTGRIPSSHGVHDWIRRGNLAAGEDCAIEYLSGLRAYTDILAERGYACGISGKWHLGDSARPQKGFSFWRVFPWGGGNYHGADILRDGRLERDPRYLTDAITEGGLEFLDAQAGTEAPFYLSVHYTAPHSPWERGQHPQELVDLYRDCQFLTCPDRPPHPWQINSAPRGTGERRRELLSGYYAALSGVDRGVGRILDRLEALGARDSTLVVFTSDNGMNMGHHGVWGKGNGTFPLNMYDSSVKVPMLMAQPGRIPAGAVCDRLLSQYDLFPTLLDWAGLPNPEAAGLPGRSFAPALAGRPAPEPEAVVVFDEYGPVRMIRTREWKYVHRCPYGPHELYDLAADPGETRNLAGEPAQQQRLADLRGLLADWFTRHADPRLDGAREAVTGKGQIDLAGAAGEGRPAYAEDWWHIDADGAPIDDLAGASRVPYYTPSSVRLAR